MRSPKGTGTAARRRKVAGNAARAPKTAGIAKAAPEGIRLQLLLARAGVASRREAEKLIEAGEVTVNGRVVTELGARAVPGRDHVKVGGRLIGQRHRPEYWLYHKPVGCVTTMRDPQKRFCVGDVIEALGGHGLFPVGRLDFHTSGLLLLTNDGDLAERLMHPRYNLEKTYFAKVSPPPSVEAIDRLRGGVRLRDGRRSAPAFVRRMRKSEVSGAGRAPAVVAQGIDRRAARQEAARHTPSRGAWIEVRLHEGRNQQIRRMFEAVGSNVEKLRRDAIGPIRLGELPGGDARPLLASELAALRKTVGLLD